MPFLLQPLRTKAADREPTHQLNEEDYPAGFWLRARVCLYRLRGQIRVSNVLSLRKEL
jgi:hypothetical protein